MCLDEGSLLHRASFGYKKGCVGAYRMKYILLYGDMLYKDGQAKVSWLVIYSETGMLGMGACSLGQVHYSYQH